MTQDDDIQVTYDHNPKTMLSLDLSSSFFFTEFRVSSNAPSLVDSQLRPWPFSDHRNTLS